mmetsp:Transcript_17808/g.37170  ORF Transcript_17808/g.37170 Transcript_17808/m.37170 type:complete len:98 (+) Transcript_17808:77-370(+)
MVKAEDDDHNDDCHDPLYIAEGGQWNRAYMAEVNAPTSDDGKYQLITPGKKNTATFFAMTFTISAAAPAQFQQEYHNNFGLTTENNGVDGAWQTSRG